MAVVALWVILVLALRPLTSAFVFVYLGRSGEYLLMLHFNPSLPLYCALLLSL